SVTQFRRPIGSWLSSSRQESRLPAEVGQRTRAVLGECPLISGLISRWRPHSLWFPCWPSPRLKTEELADLPIIQHHPLADMTATRHVRLVIKDGAVMDTTCDAHWVNPIPASGRNHPGRQVICYLCQFASGHRVVSFEDTVKNCGFSDSSDRSGYQL